MKKLVSKKGSQEIYVTKRDGCVVIRAFDKRRGTANVVTLFDELLIGLIAQLTAIAATQSRNTKSQTKGEPQ